MEWNNELIANVPLEEKDLVIIGGGVAGYVAAIKAGQEGMKVCFAHRTPMAHI
jgi:dihydrolipoamide dehydrogenase